MLSIGITGGIGSGKTTVCAILEHLGYPVFYADREGKRISDSDPKVRALVSALLGPDAYLSNSLNRSWVAQQIFGNEALKDALNAIIHPAVFEAFELWKSQQVSPLIFNESALLIETGSFKRFDRLVLVTASEETRLKRIQARDGLMEDQIRARMQHQLNDDQKMVHADFVIRNDEEVLLTPQVVELVESLLALT